MQRPASATRFVARDEANRIAFHFHLRAVVEDCVDSRLRRLLAQLERKEKALREFVVCVHRILSLVVGMERAHHIEVESDGAEIQGTTHSVIAEKCDNPIGLT